MRRKNPGPSSLPNAPIDLTSLLDVIFIFLFVVMIGYALTAQKAEEAAEAAEALKAAEEELAEAGQELREQRGLVTAYENVVRDYESQVIGKRVKIVTISGSYDSEDSKNRLISIRLNESTIQVSITPDTMDSGYRRIRQMIKDYIDLFDDSKQTVVVFSVNSVGIQHRDRLKLDAMIDEFTTEYSFVY